MSPLDVGIMRPMYDDVEKFCVFIGYTRSGHSLVGSLLDAHPEAVIAHDGQVFEFAQAEDRLKARAAAEVEEHGEVRAGTKRELRLVKKLGGPGPSGGLRYATREAMFNALVARAERQGHRGRPGWRLGPDGKPAQTSYGVEGAWQGKYTTLRVIGAKRGQEPPMVWAVNHDVFSDLAEFAQAEVRLVHVYRNPWDNIASMTRIHGGQAAKRYFKRARLIEGIKADGRWPVIDVCLEELIADPEGETARLYEFYDLEPVPELLQACAGLVDPEPNPSRNTREWTKQDIAEVARGMRDVPWLARYPDTPQSAASV